MRQLTYMYLGIGIDQWSFRSTCGLATVTMRTGATISPPDSHWAKDIVLRWEGAMQGDDVFLHRGTLDRALLEQLLTTAEARSVMLGEPVGLRKRMFNILVEGLENVHVHTPPDLAQTGFAIMQRIDDGYRMAFGNAMPIAAATLLSQRVATLNQMNEGDLRAHFLELLANDSRTERGGAGLGLLTMARRSSAPLVVHTVPRDVFTTYLALQVRL